MSALISNAFVAQFDAEVKQAFQGESRLTGTIRTRTGVVGSTYRFPKMGKGLAQPRIPQSDVTPMNTAHSNATATLTDWNASEYTDLFDQQKINFDERRELVKVISGALGRRLDQLVIAAADAAGTTLLVPSTVGTNAAMDMTKLRRTSKLMDAQGVPQGGRHFILSAAAQDQLLGSATATGADYVTMKVLTNGRIDELMGFKFHLIEDRTEGGLTLAGTDRTLLAWHESAVGLAIGINMSTEINYVAEKTSWLTTGKLSAGAVGIDALGIVEITIDESVAITS